MVWTQRYTRVWTTPAAIEIRHGFNQQAALLLGTEGDVVDAGMC